jgi:hypothetical protein
MRRQHPGWGPRRIEFELAKKAVAPMPSRSSIYRCLKRHSLIDLRRKRRRREEFRRWERERPMQLWQMDVMGGVLLDDGTELKVLTGIDDHSRFCIAAGLMRRATSRAVCEIFLASLRTHGVPDEIASLHPHKFPHTFATKYLFKGGNESVLMTEAGWSSNIASVAFLVSAIARIVEARNRAIGAYVQMSSLTKRKEFTETASSELCLTAYVEDWPLRPAQDPKHQARYPVTASPIIHDAKCHQVPFGGAPHEHAEQD